MEKITLHDLLDIIYGWNHFNFLKFIFAYIACFLPLLFYISKFSSMLPSFFQLSLNLSSFSQGFSLIFSFLNTYCPKHFCMILSTFKVMKGLIYLANYVCFFKYHHIKWSQFAPFNWIKMKLQMYCRKVIVGTKQH